MSQPFRKKHLLELAESWQESKLPLDRLMASYFRSHRSLGAKDRKWISEMLYLLFRKLSWIDSFLTSPINWEKRLSLLDNLSTLTPSKTLAEHTQVSFPKILFQLLEKRFQERTPTVCSTLTQRAPLCLRANPLKTTRQALKNLLEKHTEVREGTLCEHSLYLENPCNVFTWPEFKEGLFEVQDEGSAFVAQLPTIKPKQWVLDYCAGSGGKSLAFAHKMQKTGQLFLYDIRPHALEEAKKRLRRAGIQNAQWIKKEENLQKLQGKMDVVVLDVPCTGTGTYRRNPDLKWKFQPSTLSELVEKQRLIFDKALPFVKQGGEICYITCSLLLEENEEQIAYFLAHYPISQKQQLFLEPTEKGNDGFFFCRLAKM